MRRFVDHFYFPWAGSGGGGGPTPPTNFVKRSIKQNNIMSFLGDSTEEDRHIAQWVAWNRNSVQFYGLSGLDWNDSGETDMLRDFIVKCYAAGILYVGGIRSNANGFQEMFDYNAAYPVANQQFNDFNVENEFWFGQRYQYTVQTAATGFVYRITLDGVPYQYARLGGDSNTDVRDALYALIPTSPTVPATWTKSLLGSTGIQIWADSVNTPFTSSTSASISTTIINLSRNNWLLMVEQLKTDVVAASGTNWETGTAWHTSTYVQNYAGGSARWGSADADRMIICIDVYESTNYTTAPDPDRSIESQYYLLANALAANPSVKTKQICQFINSTEPDYEHGYYSTHGITATEATWMAGYTAYGTTAPYGNSAFIEIVGSNFFVYNTMFKAFYPSGHTAGVTYSITLDGITYSYLCQPGDSANDVMDAIYALIPASTSKYVRTMFSGDFVSHVIQIRTLDVANPVTGSASAGIIYEPEITL